MNMSKYVGLLSLVLVLTLAFASFASAVPVTVDRVEIDDIELFASQTNQLNLERDNEFEVEVRVTALNTTRNLEIAAFMSGYEYNSRDRIYSATDVFDVRANSTYVRTLTLRLPENIDADTYELRLIISDRNGEALTQEYTIDVDTERHKMAVKDIMLSPSGAVQAGQGLIAQVRVENQGQKTERDVKVMVSIPELGVSASDFIDRVDRYDDEEETEEMFLRLPRCAEPGTYDVNVRVDFNERFNSVSETRTLTVTENPACTTTPVPVTVVNNTVSTTDTSGAVEGNSSAKSTVRTVLEVILLVLVGLLVIVALVIGFSKLKSE